MKLKDFSTLKRLMMLTTSDSDAEALAALRKANALLLANGVDWDRVFGRTVQVINEFEPAPDDDPDQERTRGAGMIDAAFETLAEVRGGFADFITSLQDQWTKRRFLSDKQKEALFRAARNAEDARR